MEIKMKIDSKSFVLNTLSQDASWITNKKIFFTLGHQLTQILVYLIDQYKYFEVNNALRKDGSFYISNIDLQVYNTMNENQIQTLKKKGVEEGIFKISLEGIPVKSYYYLNFDKIAEIGATDKTNNELALEYFKKTTGVDIELQVNNEEDILNLNKLSYKELRFYCKRNNITYTGKHKTKNSLIELILEKQCPELLKADFSTVDDISSTSGQKNIHCGISVDEKISTSGQKNIHCEEIVSSEIQWTENRPLVEEISAHNQEQINQEQNTCHVHEKNKKDEKIENIFHELGINYTDTNEASCLLILNEFEGNKILLEKYLLIIYKQLERLTNIKNLAALFSKKLKEIDYSLVNKIKKENKNNIEKTLENQKKIKDEERSIENTSNMDKIIDNFLSLDKEIQENVVNLAEQKFLKENPQTNLDMFKAIKKRSYRSHLRMIYSKLLEIIKDENIKIGEVI
ncbi:Uncharacterised protein [Fusobacterium polymorphum]|uniref:Uncharacterized protein n=1 Tax=Fusobacterium polymorphum ATCC 10953 TaxID=393480 RepID=A5TXG9_FUSNP|nr:hypothetical protein [Fusobacterium polymorphum]EDK89594.1 hypothetical protein FNP_1822 [Fusobacterium polymorphum ATCC 10953]UTI52492.1 hypothetical protein NLJ26_08750 [Fusobacterium polymorphum]WRL69229.1 hypothetical protein VKN78_03850 [Fusobacterium polymorphum]CKH05845.1 Uncharacterised protein [Fusobacterium polymorphum]